MFDFIRPYPASYAVNVGSGWGVPRANNTRSHEGLDIGGKVGTPIVAVAAGTVYRIQNTDTGAAGLYVGVRHPGGYVTRYMHMSRIEPTMRVGLPVAQGQVLGYVGNTGASEGPHLHIDLRVPPTMLEDVERAVGKPKTGWGKNQEGHGVAIPGEPWIPVDSYRTSTVLNAVRNQIPLYTERKRKDAARALLTAVVFLGGFALYRRSA